VSVFRSSGLLTPSRAKAPWPSPWYTLLAVPCVLVILVLPPLSPGTDVSGPTVYVAASIPPWNNWTCNPNNPSPAALDIPVPAPSTSFVKGSIFLINYEYRVASYSKADAGARLSVPQLKAVIPLSPSGKLSLSIPAKTVGLNNGNWSPANASAASMALPGNVSFPTAATAYLTSSKAAVMVNRTSGSLTIEFRWKWTFVAPHHGAVTLGNWSSPRMRATSPFLPSEFYPAPYVGIVSNSGTRTQGGSTFNVSLNGSSTWTSFRMVLEYPNNGTEIQSIWENTTGTPSNQNVSVPLTYRNGNPVANGSYLVHVHDVCEAIVHMISLKVGLGAVPSLAAVVASDWNTAACSSGRPGSEAW
jgi:hypothetical protein